MKVKVFSDKTGLGHEAARQAATAIRQAIARKGAARIIAATGASQFEFLNALTKMPDINWRDVEMFHLDEYVNLPVSHPASFRRYLIERLISKTGIEKHHLLDGERKPEEMCQSVGEALHLAPVDVAFVGIGENGHLAFNDPPADFDTEEPYLVVRLDESCRRQQVGEGWFDSLQEVPEQAISMSIRQILKSEEIICVVPDARKAKAVKACFEGEVSPLHPASILRTHPDTTVYLDRDSDRLLDPRATFRQLRERQRR